MLLPVASLPGPYGIGDLGPAAREFVSWLASAKQSIWQVLPLTVTDPDGCPYASPTAFARDPLLLSPEDLADDGFVSHADKPYSPAERVDYARVRAARAPFLAKAATAIAAEIDLQPFREARPWVETWGLFRALADLHGPAWLSWPDALRDLPTGPDLEAVRAEHSVAIERHIALQWAFDRQWKRLKRCADEHGVALWGDLPFFVGFDSADVWMHRHLFDLDDECKPRTTTGVPPDAFSPTGQLWGHPHFDRVAHEADGWTWWVDRALAALELVDVLRIDHFRGLVGVWEVEAGQPTAEQGQWIEGPGRAALDALALRSPGAALFAEDLGVITPEVEALRVGQSLPGMAILQFAFGEAHDHDYLPHNHRPDRVVYTGTHDNDTVLGWYRSAPESARDHARRYLSTSDRDFVWAVLRAGWRSVADTAIAPMQDLLSLGSEARMNIPGQREGNWSWRLGREALNLSLARRVAMEVTLSGRSP